MEVKDFVRLAIEKSEVEFQPLIGIYRDNRDGLIVNEISRKNDKRLASMQFFCPDEWTVNFRGNPKLKDSFVVIRIPKEFVEEYKNELEGKV